MPDYIKLILGTLCGVFFFYSIFWLVFIMEILLNG